MRDDVLKLTEILQKRDRITVKSRQSILKYSSIKLAYQLTVEMSQSTFGIPEDVVAILSCVDSLHGHSLKCPTAKSAEPSGLSRCLN